MDEAVFIKPPKIDYYIRYQALRQRKPLLMQELFLSKLGELGLKDRQIIGKELEPSIKLMLQNNKIQFNINKKYMDILMSSSIIKIMGQEYIAHKDYVGILKDMVFNKGVRAVDWNTWFKVKILLVELAKQFDNYLLSYYESTPENDNNNYVKVFLHKYIFN